MLDNLFKKKKPMVKLVINVSEDYFREAAKIKMDEMEDGRKEKFMVYLVEKAAYAELAKKIEEGTREFNIYEGDKDPHGAVRLAARSFTCAYNLQDLTNDDGKDKERV